MTFLLGLTGSIGMGKSTTARMFAEEGCAVWDSDAAVHRLYNEGGDAVAPIARLFPHAIVDGAVSRPALREVIAADETALKQIEEIVHPLVAAQQEAFVKQTDADIVVLDVPLLYETGRDKHVDAVAVVTVNEAEQERRLAARASMSADQLRKIRQQQIPDAEKRARADFVIVTDTLDHARAQVKSVIEQIRAGMQNA